MDDNMYYGADYKRLPVTSTQNNKGIDVLPDLYQYTVQIVNVVFYGEPNKDDFVLIDAGMPYSADKIIEVAKHRFGVDSRPKAIILTHGHFDHVGAVIELIKYWNVPVYAHKLELPHLTGEEDYQDPDTTVNGGLVAKMSSLFPEQAVNLKDHVQALPEDGSVPFMPDFRWIHTPGHTQGHVSLYREKDGALVAGDAFITVKQDSLYNVLTQKVSIYGPPRYFTTDWAEAERSVQKLEELKPGAVITGHGQPLVGKELTDRLHLLVNNFNEIAKPNSGRYVE